MKKLKLFFACLLMAVLSIGQVWATDYDLVYTLDGTITTGGNSNYDQDGGGLTQNSIGWSVTGNTTINPWRIGGKNITAVNRLVYSKTKIEDNVAKIEIEHGDMNLQSVNSVTVEVASNSDFSTVVATFTPTFEANKKVTILRESGDWSNCFYRITYNVTQATNSNKYLQLKSVKFYKEQAASDVATPTISLAAGTYAGTQSVTLACTTEGSTIYYTTDGSVPDNNSTEYTAAISVSASQTIKAIAYVGSDASSVASAEYTILTPQTTMDDIFAVASEDEGAAKSIAITFNNWVVSGAKGNTAYVTDGTKGFIVYYSGHGFTEGDILSGTAIFTIKLYNGAAELTAKLSGTVDATTGGTATLNVLDAEGIAALSGINTGSLIKISGAATSTSVVAGVTLYKTIYPESSLPSLTVGHNYNCTGVYVQYNSTKEMMPRQATDIEEAITKYTVSYEASPANGSLAIYDGSDLITSGSKVNEGTVLTIETTPATDYTLDGVTVNGSAYTESTLTLSADVTIAATFKVNTAPLVTSYILSEIGVETSHLNGEHVGDKDNLPLTAASCSKTFVGWDADEDCDHAPTYAPGAEITLAANNKFYAVYADAHVVTPTDHALGSVTIGGTSGNTPSEGYTFSKSTKGDNKTGYIQDSGTKDETIIFVQIKAESQIINEEPSAIIVTAHLAAGSDKDPLDYPVYAVLVDADGNNVGDPVALTTAVPKAGDDFSANLPTANYANVRGVKISHMKEDGWNVRYHSMSFKYQTGGTTYDNYSTDCQAQVATPTFSPAAGTYTEVQNVTIASETEDVTIYYTTNGDEPTTSSTLYNGAVEVGASMTLKAIAVKAGMANSAVATAEYTINLPLSTMDQIFAAATTAGSTATDVNIQFNNWVVSGVSTNGKNVFVTDGTKGFIIFDNGGDMGFAVGNVLSGTVACKVQLYKGAAELTTLSSATEGLNIATGGSVTPEVKAINALSGINTGAAVTINSVQFDGTNLSDGSNEIKPFNSLFAYDALENGKYYNVTGIYQQFDATKEILPRKAADIEAVSLSDPEISYTPASATIELGQSLPGTIFANPHELAISYSSNNEAVATVSNTGVIALGTETGTAVITASFAGDGTYAAANVTYTITVNPASVSENVVILAQYDTKYYAMSTTIPSEAFTAIEVEYDGSKVTVNSEADKTAIQWTKKTSGENTTFQTKGETPMYMKGTSGGAAMSLNANACNWSWDGTNEYYYIGSRTFFFQNGTGFKNYATSNLNKSGYSGKAQVIVIAPENIVISSKVDPALAYTPASDEITVGDAWSAPTLGYVEGFDGLAAITYESSNEAVATVTDAGVIALAGGTGTATITATYAGNASYLAGSATYTVKVNEPADVCDGTDDFLDTEDKGSPTSYTDRSTPNGWSAVNAGYKVIEEKAYWMINGKTTTVGVITSPELTGGLGSLKFRYANTNSESNGVSVKIEIKQGGDVVKEYTLTKPNSEVVQNTVYTELIENINVEGTFQIVITNLSPSNNTGNKDRVSIGRFCWTGYSAPEPPVYETVRTGLDINRFYTICLPKNVTAATGATFWNLKNRNAAQTEVYLEEAGLPEAGKPYIFQATAATLNVVYGDQSEDAPVANGALRGTFEDLNATQLAAKAEHVYILIQNSICPAGGENSLRANRAYIDYDAFAVGTPQNAPGKRVIAMPMQKDQAQGFENLDASEKPLKVMIEGTLYILRGEKVYDATGRLVK